MFPSEREQVSERERERECSGKTNKQGRQSPAMRLLLPVQFKESQRFLRKKKPAVEPAGVQEKERKKKNKDEMLFHPLREPAHWKVPIAA